MTTTDTNVQNLVINILTKQQYEGITTPSNDELYMVTDETISSSDVTTALGYTPENQANKVTSVSSSSTDTQYPSAKCVYDGLDNKQDTLVSGTNIKTINGESVLGTGDISISSRNIGEIVASTVPLTDAWLHLADGTLISGSGSYSDFVDYMANLYENTPETVTWTTAVQTTNLGSRSWHGLVYDGTKFVALGYSGYTSTSTDGTTWTTATQNANLGSNSWIALIYDGTKFVALGNTGYISTSTNGTTWTAATNNTDLGNHSWTALTYDGTKFVALSFTGYISTSTDGTTWTTATQNATLGNNSWMAITYDGTKFVALGETGYISTSTDGTTWTTAVQNTNLGNHNWYGLVYDGTKFVALGYYGYISTSTDGTTWTTATQNANLGSNSWTDLTYDGTKFVALGYYGYISTGYTVFDGVFTTEADWQSSVATYGVCGKYVYDSTNNTIRLPKIIGITEGTINEAELGNTVEAGLPNIEGTYAVSGGVSTTGAFYGSTHEKGYPLSGTKQSTCLGFNASLSNSIYGNSTTVQPQTTKVFYYVVIATSTKTNIEVDIDKVEADISALNTSINDVKSTLAAWTVKNAVMASDVSATTVDTDYSLSNYLPNDGKKYLVLLSGYCVTGTSSGNRISVPLKTDLTNDNAVAMMGAQTRSSSSVQGTGNALIPVGNTRKITVEGITNPKGTYNIFLRGYIRLGDN